MMTKREPLPRAAELEDLARGAGFSGDEITSTCIYIVERDVAFAKPVRDRLRALLDAQDDRDRKSLLTQPETEIILRVFHAARPGVDQNKMPAEPLRFEKRDGTRTVLLTMPDEPDGPTRFALFRWDEGGEPELMPW